MTIIGLRVKYVLVEYKTSHWDNLRFADRLFETCFLSYNIITVFKRLVIYVPNIEIVALYECYIIFFHFYYNYNFF